MMVTNQRILIHSVVLKRFPPLPDLPPLNPNRSQQMTEVFSCYKGVFPSRYQQVVAQRGLFVFCLLLKGVTLT